MDKLNVLCKIGSLGVGEKLLLPLVVASLAPGVFLRAKLSCSFLIKTYCTADRVTAPFGGRVRAMMLHSWLSLQPSCCIDNKLKPYGALLGKLPHHLLHNYILLNDEQSF